MIILGIGSNLKNPLSQLRFALAQLSEHPQIEVVAISPIYQSNALLTENAPAAWQQPFLNAAIGVETHLNPMALLQICHDIEALAQRTRPAKYAPRTLDIDILAWHHEIIETEALTIPHHGLAERPFALWPLLDIDPSWRHPNADVAKVIAARLALFGSRFDRQAPFQAVQLPNRLEKPRMMGTLNITPDSFSDGAAFLDPGSALAQFELLAAGGAEIIDIGAQATNPNGAVTIDTETEWARLKPVLQALQQRPAGLIEPEISIDTHNPETAARAVDFGVAYLNDQSGLSDARYRAVVRESGVQAIFMHSLSLPVVPGEVLPCDRPAYLQLRDWARARLALCEADGLLLDRLTFDVGIGFGNTPYQAVDILQHLAVFEDLSCGLMVGHSRKSFMGILTGRAASERDFETALITAYLARSDLEVLRVHDPAGSLMAMKLHRLFHASRLPYSEKTVGGRADLGIPL